MPADIILNDDDIEMVGARSVSITGENGDTSVEINGRIEAERLDVEHLEVGAGERGRPDAPGRLTVNGRGGEDVFRVLPAQSDSVRCELGRGNVAGTFTIGGGGMLRVPRGRVTADRIEGGTLGGGELAVGLGAPEEPKEAGIIRVRGASGSDRVEIDAGGIVPTIKIRWKRPKLPRPQEFRVDMEGVEMGSGIPGIGVDGTSTDVEEDEEGVDFEEMEIDLVQQVLFLSQAVGKLVERVNQLENT